MKSNFNIRRHWLLGRQPALGGHSRDTRRALAFHLGHSRVTCFSLQLHMSFTRSFLIHTSFTCGSLDQQSVQWMLLNWLVRAWRLASTKHSLIRWFSAKALPILVSLISFQCLSFPTVVSSQTFPDHFPCSKPTVWPMTEQRRPTLMPLPVILLPIFVSSKTIDYFLRVLHIFIQDSKWARVW